MRRPDNVCWALGLQLYIGSADSIEKGLRDVYNNSRMADTKKLMPGMCLVLFSTPGRNMYAVADDYSAGNLDSTMLADLGFEEVRRFYVYDEPPGTMRVYDAPAITKARSHLKLVKADS